MINIKKLADHTAKKLADFINPDDTGHPHKLVARIVEQEYNRLVQEFNKTINPTTLISKNDEWADWTKKAIDAGVSQEVINIIKANEPIKHHPDDPTTTTESEHQHYEQLYHSGSWPHTYTNIEQQIQNQQNTIKQLSAENEHLNKMLHQTGYGQGQIDAYTANSEELDTLKNNLNKIRDILNVSGIVQHANAPEGITIYTPTNTTAVTLYELIVKIATNQISNNQPKTQQDEINELKTTISKMRLFVQAYALNLQDEIKNNKQPLSTTMLPLTQHTLNKVLQILQQIKPIPHNRQITDWFWETDKPNKTT